MSQEKQAKSFTSVADLDSYLQSFAVNLSQLGDEVSVSFMARRLAHARVLWVNERWFLERGVDVWDGAQRALLYEWLLDSFAFIRPLPFDSESDFCDAWCSFEADRYGGSGGVQHGGSGRVGARGAFQVKGIGATPLVGQVQDWSYSHGCMWLEEAIREAICAEVVDAEFVHGAVPILAVIDTGLYYAHPDTGVRGERRALAVRPAVLRPAHLERAANFLSNDGSVVSVEIERDVRRTESLVRRFWQDRQEDAPANSALSAGLHEAGFERFVKRLAQQVAFGRVHRLLHGGYFSSNLAIDAALLDFGGFRALPSWERIQLYGVTHPFGQEELTVDAVIRSMVFFLNKYRPKHQAALDEGQMLSLFKQSFADALDAEFLDIWGLDGSESVANQVLTLTRAYYDALQRISRPLLAVVRAPEDWVHRAALSSKHTAQGVHADFVRAVDEVLRKESSITDKQRYLIWMRALRLLRPRGTLYRELLQDRIFREIRADEAGESEVSSVHAFVNEVVGLSRRHWRLLDASPLGQYVLVNAHAVHQASVILLCSLYLDTPQFLWCECPVFEDGVFLLGVAIALAEIKQHSDAVVIEQKRIGFRWAISSNVDTTLPFTIKIGSQLVSVPVLR